MQIITVEDIGYILIQNCIAKEHSKNMSLEENGTKRKASDELSDEDDQVTAAKLPAKRSKDCPYLDSINRKVLDFGKLKKLSLILLNIKYSRRTKPYLLYSFAIIYLQISKNFAQSVFQESMCTLVWFVANIFKDEVKTLMPIHIVLEKSTEFFLTWKLKDSTAFRIIMKSLTLPSVTLYMC